MKKRLLMRPEAGKAFDPDVELTEQSPFWEIILNVSLTKVVAFVGAVINVLQTFDVITLSPAQLEGINAVLIALGGIFLRDAINRDKNK